MGARLAARGAVAVLVVAVPAVVVAREILAGLKGRAVSAARVVALECAVVVGLREGPGRAVSAALVVPVTLETRALRGLGITAPRAILPEGARVRGGSVDRTRR